MIDTAPSPHDAGLFSPFFPGLLEEVGARPGRLTPSCVRGGPFNNGPKTRGMDQRSSFSSSPLLLEKEEA